MLDIEAESIVRLWKGVGRTSVINRIAGGSPTIDESNMRLLHVEKLHAKKMYRARAAWSAILHPLGLGTRTIAQNVHITQNYL